MTGKTMWMAALAATTMMASATAQDAPLPCTILSVSTLIKAGDASGA